MRFWPFKKPLLELLGIFDPEFDRVMNAIEAEERRHWMAEEQRREGQRQLLKGRE